MITPGICSVTFRSRSPAEIVQIAAHAGLKSIEWGGDLHVPAGDLPMARRAAAETHAAGLVVASYGSYFTVGKSGHDLSFFAKVLDTAEALRSRVIRIWCGQQASARTSPEAKKELIQLLRKCADAADARSLRIACEWHTHTLFDTRESVAATLHAAAHPALNVYWQPINGATLEQCLASLDVALPFLENIHVFHWWPDPGTRHPLKVGAERWAQYLAKAAETGRSHHALLEFVMNDDPAQLLADAAALHQSLAAIVAQPPQR